MTSCDECKFYREARWTAQDIGICCRYAPRPEITPAEADYRPNVRWPIVWANSYCGEWKRA